MIEPALVVDTLRSNGVSFFAGVPDSLLKHFCAHVIRHAAEGEHVIAANEGAAVALAAGHYFATGRPGLVYMQNSGLGNAVNPLVSLASPDVFGVPMLLLVGWRGEPGVRDEPQHVRQGRCTVALLESIGVPAKVLPDVSAGAADCIADAIVDASRDRTPVALVVRDGTFAAVEGAVVPNLPGAPAREAALEAILESVPHDAVVVCTTGMASRELFEIRRRQGQADAGDLRVVGSMGHASQIALGIAMAQPDRSVYCVDGDGALLMHMGSLALIGTRRQANLFHIVLNNGAHDSVGGQPTAGLAIDICAIARACGYAAAHRADDLDAVRRVASQPRVSGGTTLLEVRVATGARAGLGRPDEAPAVNRERLMAFLGV